MVHGKKKLTKSPTNLRQKKSKNKIEQKKKSIRPHESISSFSSTTESTDSYLANRELVEEEETYDFFEAIYDSASDSEPEPEEPEYVQQKMLEIEPDFFESFGDVPAIDTLSADVSVTDEKKSEPTKKPAARGADVGRFVNPLTGQEESSSSEAEVVTDLTEEQHVTKGDEDLEEELATYESDDIPELVLPEDVLDEIVEDKKPETVEDALEIFFVHQEPEKVEEEEIDYEAIAREEEAQRIYAHTMEFITDLINKAVEVVEELSPEKLLIQNLDKRKLIMELLNILPEHNIEKKCSEFLNRQVGKFHKRKQSFRNLMPDNPKTAFEDKQKLFKAKDNLDKLLMKETRIFNALSGLQDDLKSQYEQSKERAFHLVAYFENLVRKNFHRDNTPKLNTIVDQLLAKMRKYRKEISELRFNMIIQQHTQATLMKFMSQLENLGNNLHIKEFNNLQAETQTLDKKIEERNAELNKLYVRCRNDIHSLAHYKEKQLMLSNTIVLQELILDTLMESKRDLRERLYSLKIQRVHLHEQIQNLSSQGGLIDKPDLMYDYDMTVERYEEDLAMVNYLKQKMKDIETKLNSVYKTCPNIKQ